MPQIIWKQVSWVRYWLKLIIPFWLKTIFVSTTMIGFLVCFWRQFHEELGDLGQLGLHIASFPDWSAKNDSITTVSFPHYSGAAPLVAQLVKNPPANAADKRHGLDPRVRKIPWRRKWQPTPVLLPGEVCGQRNLTGYSPGSQRVGHDWEHTHTYTLGLFHSETQQLDKGMAFNAITISCFYKYSFLK